MNFTLPPNWKTSLAGLISAAASFVLFAGQAPFNIQFPVWLTALSGFILAGGLLAFGVVAKDYNVTGGSVVQTGIPVAPVPAVAPLVMMAGTIPQPPTVAYVPRGIRTTSGPAQDAR